MDISLSKLQEMVKYREAWHAAIHGVAKIRKQLSDWTTYAEDKKKKDTNKLTKQKQSQFREIIYSYREMGDG